MTQEALGLSAGCEPSYVGRIERGEENPSVDLLEALTAALGDPISALFDSVPEGAQLPAGLAPGRKPAES